VRRATRLDALGVAVTGPEERVLCVHRSLESCVIAFVDVEVPGRPEGMVPDSVATMCDAIRL
jgi:hypothetical protein